MSSISKEKAHAICIPFPVQGHINPMLEVAKLLHTNNFHITFVLTEFIHCRLFRSSSKYELNMLPDFKFKTILDGLPYSDENVLQLQDPIALCNSTSKNCLPYFRSLLAKLNEENNNFGCPPVSCIVFDGTMSFALDAAQELGIPHLLFWTTSACGFLAYIYFHNLIEYGIIPLRDMADMSNGFLNTEVDFLPGFIKGIHLKDFPSFIRTIDVNDALMNYFVRETSRASKASAIILNTFDGLEQSTITELEKILPPIYSIGPLTLITNNKISSESPLGAISTSLWKKDDTCFQWLDGREPRSVVYVNFGSITVMSNEQLVEFAWGLSNSNYEFLWVIRPDLVEGESSGLPPEFIEDNKEKGLVVSWCDQREVLMHPTVAVFLTHSGWNSTIESICGGVPMICWPFFAEQHTNCLYACKEWGIGMEIDKNVKGEDVEELIREIIVGEQTRKLMRKKALEWREIAMKAIRPNGVSIANFGKMVDEVLLSTK